MKKALTVLALTLFTLPASAWLSEEVDDHFSTRCEGDQLTLKIDGEKVEATAVDLQGQKIPLTGELNSLTIDTETDDFNYRIILDDNGAQLRYLTIKTNLGEGPAAVHYSLSKVAGSLGEVFCFTEWKSQQEKEK